MKRYLPLILVLIIVVFIAIYFFSNTSMKLQNVKDCGSEKIRSGPVGENGYNFSIRECFLQSYDQCEPAKIYQKIISVEGEDIETGAVIEVESNGCRIHLYVDNDDSFGNPEEYDTLCSNMMLDLSSPEYRRLQIDNCDNGKTAFI